MGDFKTPLPIHRAAFTRMAAGLGLPDDGMEDLRKAFQAAERRGVPMREIERAVGEVVGEHLWYWPWFEDTRRDIASMGCLPMFWAREALDLDTPWERIAHNRRVRLLTSALAVAVYAARDLAQWQEIAGGPTSMRLRLRCGDERCPAEAAVVSRFGPRIESGDYRALPPFFAGDGSYLTVDRAR